MDPDIGRIMESSSVEGMTEVVPSSVVNVPPGGSFDLRVQNVAKRIGGTPFRMLAYNGSIPGPTLAVQQGSEIVVHVINETELDTTVHWHGLRLENQYDGVPHETQAPIPPGGAFTHRLTFPDPGFYWYHPHIREDYAQELGLYGSIVVEPADAAYWPAADRTVVLTLDDILIENSRIAAYDPHGPNFAAMGRFGNVLLIGGETHQDLEFRLGEVVRFCFTNTANTRVFKVTFPGQRMKLVGSDSGRYEHEQWVDHVVVAPSERAVVDVLFDTAGTFNVNHVTPQREYELATARVVEPSTAGSAAKEFETLRANPDMTAERERVARYFELPPVKTLALVAEMDFADPGEGQAVVYVCPMHPDVVSDEPGTCPQCGMKLMPQATATTYRCPMHPEVVSDEPGKCPVCGMKLMPSQQGAAAAGHGHHDGEGEHGADPAQGHDHGEALADGIEWEDLMAEVNRATTPANMRWKLIDRATGKENAQIDWSFDPGDQVKIRLVNEMESDHPMHHPFHVHGERFLVLDTNGVRNPNLVWKDTVLVRTAETIDILLDASNPGLWMAHCHIAEHMETGMMFSFQVRRRPSA